MSSKLTLHYFFDPLCGWCYATTPLILAAQKALNLEIRLHAGGLFVRNQARVINDSLRQHILQSDLNIAERSGRTFSPLYITQILHNPVTILDSELATSAILTVQNINRKGIHMLELVHQAHYIAGKNVGHESVLSHLAEQCDIEAERFLIELHHQKKNTYNIHIQTSRLMMRQLGVNAFPALFIEKNKHGLNPIEHSPYYQQPEAFIDLLKHHQTP